MSVRTRCGSLFALTLLCAPQTASADLEDVVPSDALAWLSIDVGRVMREYQTLDLVRLFHDEEVQDFLKPAIDALVSSGEWRDLQAGLFMARAYGIPAVIAGEVSIVVLGVGEVTERGIVWSGSEGVLPDGFMSGRSGARIAFPDLLLSIETTGREAFESSFGRALEIDPEWVTTPIEESGVTFSATRMNIDSVEIPLFHGFAGDRFVAGLRMERVRDALLALGGGAAEEGRLGSDPSFQRFRRTSSRGSHVLEAYVHTAALWRFLGPSHFSVRDRAEFASVGLDGVLGAGLVIGMESGRLRDSVSVVLSQERRGALALLDGLRSNDEAVDVMTVSEIAEGAVGGVAWRWDVSKLLAEAEGFLAGVDPRALSELQEGLAEADEQLGLDVRRDLIGGLGHGGSVSVHLPRGISIPDVVGAISLTAGSAISDTVARLLPIAVQQSRGAFEVADMEIEGADRAFYLKIVDVPVAPAFAFTSDALHFGGSVATVKRALRPSTGSAAVGDDLERCLATTVQSDLADASFLLYVDLASAAEYGLGMAGMFLPAVLAEIPVKLDPTLFPMPDTVADYLSGLLLTVRVGDDYVALDSSSPLGGVWLPAALGAVGAATQQRSRAEADRVARMAAERAREEARAVDEGPDSVFFGVNYDPEVQRGSGLHVISLVPDAPAAAAGIRPGDRIIEVGGVPVGSPRDFQMALRELSAGAATRVRIEREGAVLEISVTLGRRGDFVDR